MFLHILAEGGALLIALGMVAFWLIGWYGIFSYLEHKLHHPKAHEQTTVERIIENRRLDQLIDQAVAVQKEAQLQRSNT